MALFPVPLSAKIVCPVSRIFIALFQDPFDLFASPYKASVRHALLALLFVPATMALYSEALIAFSMPGIRFIDGTMDGRIHLLLAEYAKDCYILAICALVDGRWCATPPQVLHQVLVPDDDVTYNVFEGTGIIEVVKNRTPIFRLVFDCDVPSESSDFWEISRIISEAKGGAAQRKLEVERLAQKALHTIPTIDDNIKE